MFTGLIGHQMVQNSNETCLTGNRTILFIGNQH